MRLAGQLYIAALFVVSAVVFSPALLDYYLGSRFLVASLICAVFAIFLITRKGAIRMPIILPDLLILSFVAWNAISIDWALNFGEAVFTTGRWILFASCYFLLRIILNHDHDVVFKFISRISVLATAVLLCALYLALVQLVMDKGYTTRNLYEIKIIFGHKSVTSAFLLLLVPFNLLQWHSTKGSRRQLLLILITLQMLMILLLQSRAIYLASFSFACVMIWYFISSYDGAFWKSRPFRYSTAFIVLLLGGVLSINNELRDRLNPLNYSGSQTAYERKVVWSRTWDLTMDHLAKGVGSGNWKLQFPQHGVERVYRMQYQDVVFTRAHNDFLETAAELGVPGILLYLGMLLFPLFLALSFRKRDPWKSHLLSGSLFAFIIVSFFDFPKERIEMLILLAFVLSMTSQIQMTKSKRPLLFLQSTWLAVVILILMALNICVGAVRYRAEIGMRSVLLERRAENWNKIITKIEEIHSPLYSLDPSSMPLRFYQGIAYYNLDNLDKAEETFKSALDASPYNFHVINNLATVYIRQQRCPEALILLDRALELNSLFDEALFNSAYCLHTLGRYDEALEKVMQVPQESERKRQFILEISKAIEMKSNN